LIKPSKFFPGRWHRRSSRTLALCFLPLG
jgi:hypothetical protein